MNMPSFQNVRDDNYETQAKMRATSIENCPVAAFEFYLTKLHPKQRALFQRPQSDFQFTDNVWFGNSPLGEK